MKKKIIIASFIMCMVLTAFVISDKVQASSGFDDLVVTQKLTYEEVKTNFGDEGNQGIVKEYIGFLEDESYAPYNDATINNSELANTETFVNKDFTYQPSVFPSLRNVASSTLDEERQYLWLGYEEGGVDVVDLSDNSVKSFEKTEFTDGDILLLVGSDIAHEIYVITESGVTVISNN